MSTVHNKSPKIKIKKDHPHVYIPECYMCRHGLHEWQKDSPTDTNYEFESHCHAGAELFATKDKKYMSAYKGTGLLGVACEIIGITRRLLPLVVWAPDRGRMSQKSLTGVLTDLHNYSVMALMCMDDNNWDGRPSEPTQGDTNEQETYTHARR